MPDDETCLACGHLDFSHWVCDKSGQPMAMPEGDDPPDLKFKCMVKGCPCENYVDG